MNRESKEIWSFIRIFRSLIHSTDSLLTSYCYSFPIYNAKFLMKLCLSDTSVGFRC